MGASRLPPVLALLRPRQWYKQGIVLVPLLFSGNALDGHLWVRALVAAFAFCMLASATYAANDVADRERDRLHPRKQFRPVASGAVPVPFALFIAVVLALGGLLTMWFLNPSTLIAGLGYLVLQVFYNAALKRVVLWDALAVAAGFVLRALAGTTALEIGDATEWLIVCTFLFAFYLALAKRRHELLNQPADNAVGHRPVLAGYSVGFLEQTMWVATGLLLMAYSLYTFSGTTKWMMFTLPFAYYGVLRYNHLVHHRGIGDEAELILRDRPSLLNGALWLVLVVVILAGWPERGLTWLEAL